MDTRTALHLNELNTVFYKTVAADFAGSRQYFWSGWDQVAAVLKNDPHFSQLEKPTLLDLGCGTGRWQLFFAQEFGECNYTGVDNSAALLEIAKHTTEPNNSFILHDFITPLIATQQLPPANHQNYDLITVYGVLHHIPALSNRKALIQQLFKQLNPGGYLVVTAWQFLNAPHIQRKIVSPESVDIDPQQLEPNDFFLDWQRGPTAVRYCHCCDETERNQLQAAVQSDQYLSFAADGKTNDLNQYLIWKKPHN